MDGAATGRSSFVSDHQRRIITEVQSETTKDDTSALLSPTEFEGIMAISLPMRFVFQQVIETAAVDGPVLITGETGTGKDMVAAAIHKRSERQHRPYVPVNMGAISHELIASELFGHEKGAFTGASDYPPGSLRAGPRGNYFSRRNYYHGREAPDQPVKDLGNENHA
jgi:DNA-binding NtrC family response regulator